MYAHHTASSRRRPHHSSSQNHNRYLSIFSLLRAYHRSIFVLDPCACKEDMVQHGR
jgi:hypothetical protein